MAANPTRQQTQLTEVKLGGQDVPSVIVGSVVEVPNNAGPYDLYFIFPMEQEVATMDLIGNAFLVAGVILTLLVGAVAWVVTRQVVTPVRRAGEVAQRLSAGRLNERMPARGEDDLAVLATSFNNMADSLQSQIRQLEGLSAVQQRFVSDVSHELRTPLTTIRMAVDVIHGSRDDFQAVGRALGRAARRRARPVRGTARRPARDQPVRRRRGGPRPRAGRPARHRAEGRRGGPAPRRAARQRRHRPRTPSEPAEAEIDERRVERILRNLVVNAVEHGEGRPVDVHVGVGPGRRRRRRRGPRGRAAPGEAANVFTRFWRADPARARTTGGTGLGLSISLEDARLHNGWLQAWGEPGEGSRFRLTLPRRAGRQPPRLTAPAQPGGRAVSRRRAVRRALAPRSCSCGLRGAHAAAGR